MIPLFRLWLASEPRLDLAGAAAEMGLGNQTQKERRGREKSQGCKKGMRHVGSMRTGGALREKRWEIELTRKCLDHERTSHALLKSLDVIMWAQGKLERLSISRVRGKMCVVFSA